MRAKFKIFGCDGQKSQPNDSQIFPHRMAKFDEKRPHRKDIKKLDFNC